MGWLVGWWVGRYGCGRLWAWVWGLNRSGEFSCFCSSAFVILYPPSHTTPQAFGRRIATDKFIQLFFILNFGCLIGIIVWYAVKKGKIKPPHIEIPPLPSLSEVFNPGGSSAQPPTQPLVDNGAGDAPPPEDVAQRFLRGAQQ